MTERQIPTEIQQEIDALKRVIRDPAVAQKYFADLSDTMQEQARVVNIDRMGTVFDLLSRNIVNACNNAGEPATFDTIGDAYKEIISGGNMILGLDNQAAIEDELARPGEAIGRLQIAFNDHVPFAYDADASLRVGLVDSLLFANQQLLTSPDKDKFTAHTSLDYYCQNIAVAKLSLEPR